MGISGRMPSYRSWKPMLSGQPVDLVLSDMAPNKSGVDAVDQPRAMHLAELAMDFADGHLQARRHVPDQAVPGRGFRRLRAASCGGVTPRWSIRKPAASRKRSPEVYALAQGKLRT